MRLYLDSNAVIYAVEGEPAFRKPVLDWIRHIEDLGGSLVTSRLSRLECRSKPLRDGDDHLLASYEQVFESGALGLLEIDADVVERATLLRAQHRFRTPDAIHVASAILSKVDAVLSGDSELARCTDVRVVLLPQGPGS